EILDHVQHIADVDDLGGSHHLTRKRSRVPASGPILHGSKQLHIGTPTAAVVEEAVVCAQDAIFESQPYRLRQLHASDGGLVPVYTHDGPLDPSNGHLDQG